MAAVTITPMEAAEALGISLWELATAQSNWAREYIRDLNLDVTSNRQSDLEDFDNLVASARAHWEGALETMKAIDSEDS